jgi:hypothetical protein
MRPASIVQFERIFLAALAVDVVAAILGLEFTLAALKANPATASYGASAVIGTQLIFVAIAVGLWYLAAHRRSVVAKWIIAAWFVLASCMLALSLFQGAFFGLATVLGWLGYALRAWSVSYLFKPDADAWFAKPSAG